MLTDKQSLVLTGLMIAGIFIFGVLDKLQNFIVLTMLTIVFLIIVLNIFLFKNLKQKKEVQDQNDK